MHELRAPIPTLGACLSLLPAGKTALAACIPPIGRGGEIKWLEARVIESFHVWDDPILLQLQKGQSAPQWRAPLGERNLSRHALGTALSLHLTSWASHRHIGLSA